MNVPRVQFAVDRCESPSCSASYSIGIAYWRRLVEKAEAHERMTGSPRTDILSDPCRSLSRYRDELTYGQTGHARRPRQPQHRRFDIDERNKPEI